MNTVQNRIQHESKSYKLIEIKNLKKSKNDETFCKRIDARRLSPNRPIFCKKRIYFLKKNQFQIELIVFLT